MCLRLAIQVILWCLTDFYNIAACDGNSKRKKVFCGYSIRFMALLNIEAKVHAVAVLHDIILTLKP
jgi:hypothetical protein